jgi:hypothetical protein
MTDKIITEEIILNAESYIDIETKSNLSREFAKDCVSEVNITLDNEGEKDVLPPRYQENPKMKSLYGMMTLLYNYLHVLETDENGTITFTSSEFDEWGRVCVMNQLDRFKSSKNIEVRNKVYDILDDYREFYRMLGVEIAALVANKNDPLSRFLEYFKTSITPDMVKDVIEAFSNSMREIAEYKESQEDEASESVIEGE